MQLLNIHTHHRTVYLNEFKVLSLSVGHDKIAENETAISVGIHPWFIKDTWQDDVKKATQYALLPSVKMIGECGLDKIKGASFPQQIHLFETQLQIAKSVKKPVIIHCVKAFDEVMASCKKINPGVPLIIHGFNKSETLAKQLIKQRFTLSVGKAILQDNPAARLVKSSTDFLLETDGDDFPIEMLYQAAANLKNTTVDEIKALIFANWKKLNII